MRRYVTFCFFLSAFFFLNSCKLIDELRTFDMSYSVEFTIPSSTLLNLPINLPTPPVTTNTEQRFEDEGVKSEWVESVKLNNLKITIISPQGQDFNFLQNISMYMNTAGEPEVLIADKVPVADGAGNTIELDVKGVDLYPYISKNDFTLRTEVTTDELLTQNVDFKADMDIDVKATIPGSN